MARPDFEIKVDDLHIRETLKGIPAFALEAVARAQKQNAMFAESIAKNMIRKGSRSGRLYKRGKKMHQASAKGEPPKSDYGHLVNTIRGYTKGIEAFLSAAASYARDLEFGTKHMSARPFMRKAAMEMIKNGGLERIKNALRTAIRTRRR